MRLPNANDLIIEREKVLEYVRQLQFA